MKIYRGESLVDADISLDPQERAKRIDAIKKFAPHLLYPSKLSNHGNPYHVVRTGLLNHALQHISQLNTEPNFENTSHLLSFSQEYKTAIKFGTSDGKLSLDAYDSGKSVGGTDTTQDLEKTEYLLIEMDIKDRIPVPGFKGVYSMTYLTDKKVLLINSLEFLLSNSSRIVDRDQYDLATGFAKDESEWLVLPADPLNQYGTGISFSSFLHTQNLTINMTSFMRPE